VSWGSFSAFYALTLLVAALLSWAMYASFAAGWYIMVVMPAIAALLVSAMLTMTIRVGKCRKPLAAGIGGIIAGTVLYLGSYYCGMVALTGVENAWRVNLLPAYLTWRMQTDLHRNVGRPDPGGGEREPDPVMNWIFFGLEFATVLWLTGLLVRRRAMKPFCERCDAWKQQDLNTYPPGNGETIRQWLEAGELGKLASVPTYTPSGKQKRFTSVSVESCAAGQSDDPCPVYFAVKDVSMGGSISAFQRFDGSPGKLRVPRIELTPIEVEALAPVFHRLQHSRQKSVSAFAASEGLVNPSIPAVFGGSAVIDVQPVPEGEARRVLNASSIAITNVLVLMTLVVFFGSIAGFGYGIHVSNILEVLDHKARPEPARMALGLGLSALSALFAFITGYVGLRNASAPGNIYFQRRARHYFGMRVSPIVDLTRPSDEPRFFVEVVPRNNWGKLMLETASDIGFLEVDGRRREIRFEGDRERYRIPATAITGCTVQQVPAADGKIIYHMVVLSGSTREGSWEAPFCKRQTQWNPSRNHREAGADEIYSSISIIAPWVIPGVAERIAAGAAATVAGAVPSAIAVQPIPAPPLAAKESFFRRYGLRLAIIVVAVGVGIWRGAERNRARKAAENRAAQIQVNEELGQSDRPSLTLQISNVLHERKLTKQPPYHAAGGNWTVFDCAPAEDESARITIAVRSSTPSANSRFPISFAMAAVLPSDREVGGRFVIALGKALHSSLPPVGDRNWPLAPLSFPTVVLGEHLSAPNRGLKAGAGTWVATKWFIPGTASSESEIFFNFDLASGRAEFSEKDPDYDAEVVTKLAAVLRDGLEPKSAASRPDSDRN